MKNLFTTLQIGALVLLVQACGSKAEVNQPTASDAIPVKVMAIAKSKVQQTISASGQLTTDDETYLSFKTGGVVQSLRVREGDAVRKGQVLATLDLTEINAQVAQAQLALEKAQRDFNRVERLHRDSVATLEQFQNSRTGYEVARKQFEAAQFNRQYSEIRALADGYVLRKFVSEGQVVSPGASVLLTNGGRQGAWKVRCGVSDREWSAVSLNDPARVSLDAFPGEDLQAKVTRKSEGTDPSTGSFTLELTVSPKKSIAFATGMFGKVEISPARQLETWAIPFDALMDGDAKQGYVFVTEDDKTARKVNVTISGISNDQVFISAGLEKAKSLIISGSAYLTDGSAIQVLK
ncbi:MAG: efflux RND transporter periplasmic adaptor subunit [Cyclobacteriaceae bacterium]|nr:efflux RND transporter periplasmic adaptor subunit [Cyclobacteriaceae bacterium]